MSFAGHNSDAQLLGVFEVSILHNIVHLLFGGWDRCGQGGCHRADVPDRRRRHLPLWIYGLLVGKESSANFVPLNSNDNWLHLGLGIGMIALGAVLPRYATTSREATV